MYRYVQYLVASQCFSVKVLHKGKYETYVWLFGISTHTVTNDNASKRSRQWFWDIMRIHEISMSPWWRPSLSGGHQAPRWRILRIHLPGDHRFLRPWWVLGRFHNLGRFSQVSQVSRSWADSQEIYWDVTFLDLSRNISTDFSQKHLLTLTCSASMSTDRRIHLTLWLNVVE